MYIRIYGFELSDSDFKVETIVSFLVFYLYNAHLRSKYSALRTKWRQ